MNRRILGLLAAAALAGPTVASAQTTILDYQGYGMGGTSTIFNTGSYVLDELFAGPQTFTTLSTTASLNAQITVTGSVAQNDLSIASFQVNVIGNNGSNFEYTNLTAGTNLEFPPTLQAGGGQCFTESFSLIGCVKLTTSGNAVTGATFDMLTGYIKASNLAFSIGPNGDSFSSANAPFNTCGGGGFDIVGTGYTGPAGGQAGNAPCTVKVSNPTAGWRMDAGSRDRPRLYGQRFGPVIRDCACLAGSSQTDCLMWPLSTWTLCAVDRLLTCSTPRQ